MANFEEILTARAKDFEGDDYKGVYEKINSKLSSLGYEVLINQKDKAEFVPSGRLNEVVAQRETFKAQSETLNAQLLELKNKSSDTETQTRLQKMIDDNNKLVAQLDEVKKTAEVTLEARDAIEPKDIIMFVDMNKVKLDAKGNISGAKEEVDRIRKEKPHLFAKQTSRGGSDNKGGGEAQTASMNSLIRMAAGRNNQ